MAIDDNTSYELTGLQVKDLAQKVKAKVDSSSLAAVATSGDYTDLLNTPTIPTVNDATLTITQNGTTAGTFTANSNSDTTISLTDTTYTHFTGATSAADGTQGLVPGPLAGDDTKFLSGDGTWKTVSSGASKTVFIWENGAMYDEDYNTVSGGDVYTAVQSGDVEVVNSMSSLIIENGIYASWPDPTYGILTDVLFFTVERTSPTGVMTRTQYLYDESNGWLEPRVMDIQEQLTAGSNISISGNTISATDTTYTHFTGATSSTAGAQGLVPGPSAGDQEKVLHGDGTWKDATAKLVEMSYGESNAWAKFIAAYNAGSIVYCRASSNSNPASGSQTRKAFMAYVNNATSPTQVEFQYVRSQSSKTDSQQTDQVFVYTLTNASGGTWSVASRNMGPKINVSGAITKTFSNGANATITIGANAMTGATSSAAGAAGVVPAPAAGDEGKVLQGDGTWVTPTDTTYSAGANVQISAQNVISATDTTYSDMVGADSSTAGAAGLAPAPAAGDQAKVLSGAGTWIDQPTVNDATLTIQRNGANVDTFTANASTNKTIDIDVHNGVMTAWDLVPSADTTAGWRALFPVDGHYITFYSSSASFTNKPTVWGVLETYIAYQGNGTSFDFYQKWLGNNNQWRESYRRGNTGGWTANSDGTFVNNITYNSRPCRPGTTVRATLGTNGTVTTSGNITMTNEGFLTGKAVTFSTGAVAAILLTAPPDTSTEYPLAGIPYSGVASNNQVGFCIPVHKNQTLYVRLNGTNSRLEQLRIVEAVW